MRHSELQYLNSVYKKNLNRNKLQHNLNGIINYEYIYLHKIIIIIINKQKI